MHISGLQLRNKENPSLVLDIMRTKCLLAAKRKECLNSFYMMGGGNQGILGSKLCNCLSSPTDDAFLNYFSE